MFYGLIYQYMEYPGVSRKKLAKGGAGQGARVL